MCYCTVSLKKCYSYISDDWILRCNLQPCATIMGKSCHSGSARTQHLVEYWRGKTIYPGLSHDQDIYPSDGKKKHKLCLSNILMRYIYICRFHSLIYDLMDWSNYNLKWTFIISIMNILPQNLWTKDLYTFNFKAEQPVKYLVYYGLN